MLYIFGRIYQRHKRNLSPLIYSELLIVGYISLYICSPPLAAEFKATDIAWMLFAQKGFRGGPESAFCHRREKNCSRERLLTEQTAVDWIKLSTLENRVASSFYRGRCLLLSVQSANLSKIAQAPLTPDKVT